MTRTVITKLFRFSLAAALIAMLVYFLWYSQPLNLQTLLAAAFIILLLAAVMATFSSIRKLRLLKKARCLNRTFSAEFQVAYQYPVTFTENAFQPDNPQLRQAIGSARNLMVVIDQEVLLNFPDCPTEIADYLQQHSATKLACQPITMPAGEEAKTQKSIDQLHRQMLDCQLDRFSRVIAIGNGSILDAVGFACATFHRGVSIIRLPTTILGQNDAGVGVKNAINASDTKNLIGTFAPPLAVINDFRFIASLPERDKLSGMAEAVKVAAIRDRGFFQWLENNAERLASFEPGALKYMIQQCAALHLKQISQGGDPFERGNACPLDFGHWSAHKLESLSGYQLRHGEAVAIGMALDTRYAVDAGILSSDCGIRVFKLLERLGFRLWHPAIRSRSAEGRFELLDGLEEFRQHLGGQLSITLLTAIGRAKEFNQLSSLRITEGIRWLEQRAAAGSRDNSGKRARVVLTHQESFQAG
ncbi:MAG: 3-dehydroquinate synthase [Endozoicomonas sp.]